MLPRHNYHLQAIGASVVGGASLSGGRGKLSGTVYGILIMGILYNGLNLLKVSSFWQDVAVGATIVIAVVVDALRYRKKSGKKGGVKIAGKQRV
jgi:ribose transport system permease protein